MKQQNWKDKLKDLKESFDDWTETTQGDIYTPDVDWDKIEKLITDLLEEQKKEFSILITKEIVIAQDEGKPTSRLTSLFNKLNK